MVNGIRKVLYCLLLIALPLQALASVGMQPCMSMRMPLSHATDGSATLKNDAAGVAQPDSVSAAINGCGDPAQENQPSDRSADHCTALIGCGIAAAFVSALPLVMQLPADGAPVVSQPSPFVGFLTDAPERPPRTTA